ncbi:MAG: putative transport system permease protein, partial [Gemmatimonadaceae bacterium]|nr:putative transport system permease protein [Gemmatimonadaceae bacterium]
MIFTERIQSNVQIAVDTLRANKLRSSLTILGVVIGVSTVMTMAAIVQGIQGQIVRTIEIAGPTTFYVVKVFSQTPVNPDRLPKWIRVRPDLVEEEAARIRQLPEISYAAMWAQTNGRLTYGAQHTQTVAIMGADDRYQEIQGGELLDGRWFTPAELVSGSSVVVLDENAAHKLFGRESILDKEIRIGGRPATVIGVYAQPGNIFSPPGQDIGAIVPYQMLDHQFTLDKTNALY